MAKIIAEIKIAWNAFTLAFQFYKGTVGKERIKAGLK